MEENDVTGCPHNAPTERPYMNTPDNNCPISRLPSEILVQIFSYLIAHRPAVENRRPAYIDFTYVCHDWREIALNTPSLWTQPDVRWLRWVREMLRRSKYNPLRIVYNVEDAGVMGALNFESAMTDILVHTHRIASLSLRLDPWVPADIGHGRILYALDKSAPLLQTLEVSFSRALHPSHIPFPEPLFADATPRLRKLILDGCHFVWNSPLLEHLTTFCLRTHIEAVMSPCTQCPTTKQFMKILRAMPELEVLSLDSSLPYHLSEAPDPSCTVYFPRMRDLRLVGSSVLDCTSLLQRISFPQSSIFEISCTPLDHENDAVPLFSALSHTFPSCPDPQTSFEKLQIEGSIMGADHPTLSLDVYNEIDALHPDFKIRLSLRRHTTTPLVQPAIKSLPLASLQVLTFTCTDCSTNCFVACFGSLPKLRTIILTQRNAVNFVYALRDDLENDYSESTSSPVLPFHALETLFMRDVDFEDLFQNDTFAGILMKRADRGARLRSLLLRECVEVHKEEIDRFKELAKGVDVDWDGYSIKRNGDEDTESEEELEGEWYQQQFSDYESEE